MLKSTLAQQAEKLKVLDSTKQEMSAMREKEFETDRMMLNLITQLQEVNAENAKKKQLLEGLEING